MKVLGLKCTKDTLDWSLVEGDARATARIIETRRVTVRPHLERPAELAWIRQEIIERLTEHAPDCVALAPVEPGGQRVSVGRAECDGVVQEACESHGVPLRRFLAATIRGAFGATRKVHLEADLKTIPCLKGVAASRREPSVAALAALDA